MIWWRENDIWDYAAHCSIIITIVYRWWTAGQLCYDWLWGRICGLYCPYITYRYQTENSLLAILIFSISIKCCVNSLGLGWMSLHFIFGWQICFIVSFLFSQKVTMSATFFYALINLLRNHNQFLDAICCSHTARTSLKSLVFISAETNLHCIR